MTFLCQSEGNLGAPLEVVSFKAQLLLLQPLRLSRAEPSRESFNHWLLFKIHIDFLLAVGGGLDVCRADCDEEECIVDDFDVFSRIFFVKASLSDVLPGVKTNLNKAYGTVQ